MQAILIGLVMLNMALLTVNFVMPTAQSNDSLPKVEAGIPTLELIDNVVPAAYSSSAGIATSSCYTIGPYVTERSAQLVMARIRNYGLAVQMRSLQTLETLDYLVYIPVQSNLEQARTVVADLKRNAVQESLIIDAGPYKNAISLGFFNDMNKAMRHAEYIRYLGYDARYTAQKAKRGVFWLDYDEPFGSNTPVLAWSQAVDSSASPQLIPRACNN